MPGWSPADRDRAALDAGTTRKYQTTDWDYLTEYTDEQLMEIVQSKPAPGTSFAAEKTAAMAVARARGLIA